MKRDDLFFDTKQFSDENGHIEHKSSVIGNASKICQHAKICQHRKGRFLLVISVLKCAFVSVLFIYLEYLLLIS
jgi:hypothetical protein